MALQAKARLLASAGKPTIGKAEFKKLETQLTGLLGVQPKPVWDERPLYIAWDNIKAPSVKSQTNKTVKEFMVTSDFAARLSELLKCKPGADKFSPTHRYLEWSGAGWEVTWNGNGRSVTLNGYADGLWKD